MGKRAPAGHDPVPVPRSGHAEHMNGKVRAMPCQGMAFVSGFNSGHGAPQLPGLRWPVRPVRWRMADSAATVRSTGPDTKEAAIMTAENEGGPTGRKGSVGRGGHARIRRTVERAGHDATVVD